MCIRDRSMSSQQSRSQIQIRFWAVDALARDEVRHSVCCSLFVPHFVRLSRHVPGVAPAVFAARPGEASCCPRFFTQNMLVFDPNPCSTSQNHCNTRANSNSTAGSIKGAVCDIVWFLSREGVVMPPNATRCVTAPHTCQTMSTC